MTQPRARALLAGALGSALVALALATTAGPASGQALDGAAGSSTSTGPAGRTAPASGDVQGLAERAVAPRALGPRLVGRATVRVPLKKAWNVKALRALRLADGPMTCRAVALVRRAPAPASAVSVSCVGPAGSPGLAYRLTVSVPAVHRAAAVSVRFPQPSFPTVARLTSAAPVPAVPGAATTVGQVGFFVPAGWTRTDFTDATSVRKTVAGITCEVAVFHPVVPDLSGPDPEASLDAQLYGITSSYYGATPVRGEYGVANPYATRRSGNTGFGFPWVGLTLEAGGTTTVEPYLMLFAQDFAVPVVASGLACSHGMRFGVEAAMIFQSVTVSGAAPTLTGYQGAVRGQWSSASSSAAVVDVFAANRHYIQAASTGGAVVIGGSLYGVNLSWAGAGNYAVVGPLLGRFPLAAGKRPSSSLISIFTETRSTGTSTVMCSITASSTGIAEGCRSKIL